jgi:predicted naringenin-chalcone synthase
MTIPILGLATAVPEHVMSQKEATQLASEVFCRTEKQTRTVKALYRMSGVKQRHTAVPHRLAIEYLTPESPQDDIPVAPCLGPTTGKRMRMFEEHAPPLALRASAAALEEAGVRASEVTHLVTISCTGFSAPGIDYYLMRDLSLGATVSRVQVGYMGCHGAINGLRVATALAAAEPQATVLMCAVELCTLHYCFEWDAERIVGNALFGDGAAALVLGGNSESDRGGLRMVATGSCLLPNSSEDMGWRIGDYGFEMKLSARVPDLIKGHLHAWLSRWLAGHGLDIEAISGWAVHPGGPRVIGAVEETLGLSQAETSASREVLAACGNMSSPTILFILDRLRRSGVVGPCLALGFGPGIFAEVALLDAVQDVLSPK